mgnify:CR=1 FL=1
MQLNLCSTFHHKTRLKEWMSCVRMRVCVRVLCVHVRVRAHLSYRQAAGVCAAPDPSTPEAAASSARPAPESVAPSAEGAAGAAFAPPSSRFGRLSGAAPCCPAVGQGTESPPPTPEAVASSAHSAPDRAALSVGGAAGDAVAPWQPAAPVAGAAAAAVAAAGVGRL